MRRNRWKHKCDGCGEVVERGQGQVNGLMTGPVVVTHGSRCLRRWWAARQAYRAGLATGLDRIPGGVN